MNCSYFNSLSDNSNIYFISESSSDVCFVSLSCDLFPCLWCDLLLKARHVVTIETEVNKPLVLEFMVL